LVVDLEGNSRPIEEIQVGEMVLARNEFEPNGPLELKRVEELFTRTSPIIELEIGGQKIGTTDEHPFYVPAREAFVPARELQAGDQLISHDGRLLRIDAIQSTLQIATVYNLRVADYHTYFVGCDEWGWCVWAHNACGPFGEGLTKQEQLQVYRRWKAANGIEGPPTSQQLKQLRQFEYDFTNQERVLGDYFDIAGIPDKAMIHLSTASTKSLQPGVFSRQIWVEAGEVRRMSAGDYRFDVVGIGARGSLPDAQTLAVRLPHPDNSRSIAFHIENNPARVQEYVAVDEIRPDKVLILPRGSRFTPYQK
jgi:hypothetical protein